MIAKRCFDICMAGLGLAIFAPVMLLVAVGVFLLVDSPVFFTQMRPGRYGVPFRIVKFRTMSNMCAPGGTPLPDEARLTRFGKFLRATSLDELPELWNVLKGDMSLVGPRPLLMEYLTLYTPEQARRHEVKPGITGWAQVNGRNTLTWEERFALDAWYVDNHSFGLDLRILLLTIRKVVGREGIAHAGEVTMYKFRGTRK